MKVSFVPLAIRLWNQLPEHLATAMRLTVFTFTYTYKIVPHKQIVSYTQMYDNAPEWDYVKYRKKKK